MNKTFKRSIGIFMGICLILPILLVLRGSPPVMAEEIDPANKEQFTLDNGDTRFIMAHLSNQESWYVNCTAVYTGKFYLFLFDERPVEKFVNSNGTIDDKIFQKANEFNTTPAVIFSENINHTVFTISLNFTATVPDYRESLLFFIQIICVSGGPDAFILISPNHEIQPYYIPFIPGYPVEFLILGIAIFYISFQYKFVKQRDR